MSDLAAHIAPPSWQGAYLALTGLLTGRRKELRLTQPALAAQLGKSLATLQRWEEGVNPPSAMDLFQWAAVLGVDITSNVRRSGDGEGKTPPAGMKIVGEAGPGLELLPGSGRGKCDGGKQS